MNNSLFYAKKGEQVVIKSINVHEALVNRLGELGFFAGAKITVLDKPTKHNILIEARGVVVALDKELCKQVIINE